VRELKAVTAVLLKIEDFWEEAFALLGSYAAYVDS
jgi:hypothetical protein